MLGFNALDQRAWLQKQKNGDFLIHRKKVAFEFSQYKSPPPMFLAPPPRPCCSRRTSGKQRPPARSCLQRRPLLCPGLLLAALTDGAGSLQAGIGTKHIRSSPPGSRAAAAAPQNAHKARFAVVILTSPPSPGSEQPRGCGDASPGQERACPGALATAL